MTQLLVKIAAKFNTTLNLKTAIGATSATLDSATDDSGVALPTGRYALTIDGGTAAEEFITCTLTSTALTNIKHVTMQGVESSGTTILHRKGATVKITDFAVIKKMLDVLDGTTNFDASTPLGYDGTAIISTANQFATKAYVDGVAIAGGADASTTIKGITKLSTAPVSASDPIAVGDNDPRVPTTDENNALAGAGGSPSSSNLYETQYDTSNGATKTATTISFTSGTKTIADSGNGFVTAGFKQGTQITITGSASNNGTFTIVSVAAGAIVVAESLVTESAGATVVMTTVNAAKLVRANGSGKIDPKFISGIPAKNFTLNENMTVGDVAWIDADGEINTWDGYKNSGDTVNAGATTYARSILIGTDKIVTFYYNGSSVRGKCGTISGDVITYGAEVTTTNTTVNFALAKVDTDAGCIITFDGTSRYYGIPFSVSGTTITMGTGVQLNGSLYSTVGTSPSICQISTGKVAFGFISGASANCNARVGSISGNVLTLGTEYTNVFSDVHTHYTAVCKYDTDKFMISAQNGTTLKSTPCAVSGTTITPGSGISTTMLTSVIHGLTQVGTNQVLLLYSLGSAGLAKFVTVSGTTATGQTAYTIDASNVYSAGNVPRRLCVPFDTDVFAFGGFSTGKVVFGRVNTSTYKIDVLESVDYIVTVDSGITEYTTRKFFTTDNTNPGKTYILNNNARYIAGILQETGTAGQSKSVSLTGGTSTIQSTLTPGETYYVQLTGGIGLSNSLYSVANTNTAIKQIGRAISTTELNITLQ